MAAPTNRERSQRIRSLDREAQQQQEQVEQLKRPQLEPTDIGTRQRIATIFVIAYFVLLLILIIGIPVYNLIAYNVGGHDESLQIPLSDIMQTYSAIVGPALGFVIAYYFKTRSED